MTRLPLRSSLLVAALAFAAPALASEYAERFVAACEALDAGELETAEAELRACLALGPENGTVAFYLACASARAGDAERAWTWLRRAVEWGYDDAAMLAYEPDLEPLREEARFAELVEELRERRPSGTVPAIRWFTGNRGGRGQLPAEPEPLPALIVGGTALHPAGRHVARHATDGSVRVLRLADGELVRSFRTEGGVCGIEYSPDGQRLLVLGWKENGGRAWEWSEATDTLRLVAENANFGSYAPDGKRMVGWRDNQRVLVELESGRETAIPDFLAWTPDGSRALMRDGDGARLVDAATLEPAGSHFDAGGRVTVAQFSADGTTLATIVDPGHVVDLWKVETGEHLHTLSHEDFVLEWGDDQSVGCVAFSSEGTRLATSMVPLRQVFCWDVASGRRLWGGVDEDEGLGGNPWVHEIAFSQDSQYVFSMEWPHVFDAVTGEEVASPLYAHDIHCTPGGRFVLFDGAYEVHVLDPGSLGIRYRRGEFDELASIRVSASGYAAGDAHVLASCRVSTSDDSDASDSSGTSPDTATLETYAARLLDPKRMHAEIDGVPVAPPVLPPLPQLTLEPHGRQTLAAGSSVALRARATSERPLHAFELRIDGVLVDPPMVASRTTRKSAGELELEWTLSCATPAGTELELRALARDGLQSAPARLSLGCE